ncbi:hypothetical protein BL250_15955 [Erwinia sp. OLTSP20]|nr:hypothetical protein BV501_10985 [Erwinia sp. OAMSP11]PIJ70812.1 hypothetical protein BK416_12175 [Erwinia sp. OLSSP12]PIJ80178.1 hypothetical protein BLD47_11040 [Erwinia sp. OLCASP19]PIJ82301.1 hypothetical protein BLD46_10790 [Erwinia sp. OLMTSP26]PIJ84988.1 hypothetical protein BLD49_10900 [Erwinia sp. OLMDSP33]PIJ89254.1 hypothetical protein BL250_15955 [Erwinia sp. OLTSP20]PIJ95085.1 hypothetical protein BL249_00035 [Erwinia sp. OLFS4]
MNKQNYDFDEIDDILIFLKLVCHSQPDDSDYLYIRSKLGLCLSLHDNKSSFFIPLRELATELDCIIRSYIRRVNYRVND